MTLLTPVDTAKQITDHINPQKRPLHVVYKEKAAPGHGHTGMGCHVLCRHLWRGQWPQPCPGAWAGQ